MIKIVAFVGKMGSGKTTASKHLMDKHGYNRMRFAERIKKMLRDGLELSYDDVDGDLKNVPCGKLCGVSPRKAMITLGTEWGRDMIHPDLWVKALDRELKRRIGYGYTKFVIDDLRFTNEAIYLDSLRSDKCKVVIVGIERNNLTISSDHVSETEQSNITPDHMIFNHYELETLHGVIDEVLEMYDVK